MRVNPKLCTSQRGSANMPGAGRRRRKGVSSPAAPNPPAFYCFSAHPICHSRLQSQKQTEVKLRAARCSHLPPPLAARRYHCSSASPPLLPESPLVRHFPEQRSVLRDAAGRARRGSARRRARARAERSAPLGGGAWAGGGGAAPHRGRGVCGGERAGPSGGGEEKKKPSLSRAAVGLLGHIPKTAAHFV